ncbi:hypothetical protein [Methylobacterium sp.]|uniref:hypothetical protein n=1 Tax=Methylobacterium sp. TaxID=409 RepID=UPI003B5C28BB
MSASTATLRTPQSSSSDTARAAFAASRKGQARVFALQDGTTGETKIVERAFDVGSCAPTEAMVWLQDQLASAESQGEPSFRMTSRTPPQRLQQSPDALASNSRTHLPAHELDFSRNLSVKFELWRVIPI